MCHATTCVACALSQLAVVVIALAVAVLLLAVVFGVFLSPRTVDLDPLGHVSYDTFVSWPANQTQYAPTARFYVDANPWPFSSCRGSVCEWHGLARDSATLTSEETNLVTTRHAWVMNDCTRCRERTSTWNALVITMLVLYTLLAVCVSGFGCYCGTVCVMHANRHFEKIERDELAFGGYAPFE
jgi:hypothetical protein